MKTCLWILILVAILSIFLIGKGKRVAIEAHIQTNKYEKDAKIRYSTSIIADRIEYLDWKDQNDNVDAADDNYYDDCSFSGYEYEDEGDIL